MREGPPGLVWLWVVYNGLAIPKVVIEMGDIHRRRTVTGMIKDPMISHRFSSACMWYKSLDTRSQFISKTRPQIIIY